MTVGGARSTVRFVERAAEQRLHAESRQQLVRAHEPRHLFRVACARDAGGVLDPQRDGLERRVVLTVGEIKRRRRSELGSSDARRLMHERDEPVRIGERQRLQQNAVDDAEDRDRRADAYAKREHGRQREGRASPQAAQTETEVLDNALKPWPREFLLNFGFSPVTASEPLQFPEKGVHRDS